MINEASGKNPLRLHISRKSRASECRREYDVSYKDEHGGKFELCGVWQPLPRKMKTVADLEEMAAGLRPRASSIC